MTNVYAIVGAIAGAAASLLARPEVLGFKPDVTSWFFSSETIEEGWIITIGVFIGIGVAAGIGLGVLLGKRG